MVIDLRQDQKEAKTGEKLRRSHGFFERSPANNYVKTRRLNDGVSAASTAHACGKWPTGSCRP